MIQQELVKAKHECEAVKAQFEKLNLRHSLLQHTLQMLDEQKGSEAKVKEFVLIRVLPASARDLDAIVRRVWSDSGGRLGFRV
jgi:hypothetical protein